MRRGAPPESFPDQGHDARAKMRAPESPSTMDNERVNAIGTLLADLAARTAALRGYL